MALHDPPQIARARRTEDVRRLAARVVVGAEQPADRPHRFDEPPLAGLVERADDVRDACAGLAVQPAKRGSAGRGELEVALPSVALRAATGDEPPSLKPLQQPADVARVEPQLGDELRGGGRVPVRELEEDADLGERERAVEVLLAERADEPRVEAVESPNLGDAGGERGFLRGAGGHGGGR